MLFIWPKEHIEPPNSESKIFFLLSSSAMCSGLQNSEFLKLIISFFNYFWCQNWDLWYKMSGKNTHIYFFYFWFKNKRVWAEKIGKKMKNSKNLKVAGKYPYILFTLVFQIFFTRKMKIINVKNSDFSKLLRLPISPIFKIQ